jgi:plastocyanin
VVLIHFPIALFITAVAFDLIAHLTKRRGVYGHRVLPPSVRRHFNASGASHRHSRVAVPARDNFAFTPGVITVKAGTQVTWVNHDDIPHTVDSTDGKFKSGPLDTNDKFEFRFTQTGEYPFYCRMHPKMTGKVIVQP